ncbi:hypothetical protein LFAB_10505 [Lactiplantibacillus fabifermentans T30PCM01]|uniref:Uncharacterized protein n=1 Tax=Lactiplantibacillus fabifermentans T30PCM01 TaxID=1400520 RepID=W6T7F9_9LACO|nr:hypothetical protein LFAB_10505 [Lactiplantibacillus fabifermentans T30PCM01]
MDLAFEPEAQVSKGVRGVNDQKTVVNATFKTIPLRSANCYIQLNYQEMFSMRKWNSIFLIMTNGLITSI